MLTRSKHHAAQNKLDHVDRITLSQQPFLSTTKNFANTVTPDGHVTHHTRKRLTCTVELQHHSSSNQRGARVAARTRKHVTRHVHEQKMSTVRTEQLNVDTSTMTNSAPHRRQPQCCPTSDSRRRTCFGHQLRMLRNGSFPIVTSYETAAKKRPCGPQLKTITKHDINKI